MSVWLVLLVGGVLTYATRLSFIVLLGRYEPPALVRRGLRFVPPAVLSAIIFQQLLVREGDLMLTFANTRLLAGVLAALVAWRTRSPLLTIAAGMATLVVLNLILGV
jgi:branched-subunit amino acid transport protein